ncbi:acyltransferase family protein [Paraglaciecola aquimarina]|uniref:Acyltransferase family protein n=1 Tax=Paraglaciecola aquimarina TaxID=1235557 RepID=A0ABU3SWC7_9ALTE|nr:acyltransferase family protein [Paraglaciecola aquimarina]MDU0354329.1 acyltransferase family protein [Paraglaciecola aquimarina]
MSSHSRVHYMDNLRAFAMLLGIFFHAALAYSPMLNQIWPTSDPQNSAIVDVLAFFSHTFRMPLFFIIAGFFAALLLNKQGLGAMIKNRLLRVTLPFVIFLPLVMISFALIFTWAISAIDSKSPMLGMIAMMSQIPDAPSPPATTTHLWFLYNLTFFYGLTIIMVKCMRFNWMRYVVKSPKLFLLLGPVLLIPAVTSQHAPLPAPEQFMPQLWSFGFYGLFYLFGYGLYKHEQFLDTLKPYTWLMLITAILAYAAFHSTLGGEVSMQQVMENASQSPKLSWRQVGIAALQAYTGVNMCLFLLVTGKTIFSQQNVAMRAIANSSYWIYIVHLPVLWVIQFALLDVQLPLLLEFLISSLGTLAIGYLSYLVLIKHTPIGWLLNGKKTKEILPSVSAVTTK